MNSEFPQITASNRDWLKFQKYLPEEKRQNHVYIAFKNPMPEQLTGQFLRVHMTRERLEDSEENFYKPEIFQPTRTKEKVLCPECGQAEERVDPNLSFCRNPKCKFQNRGHVAGPVRGVTEVLTFPDHVATVAKKTIDVPVIDSQTAFFSDVLEGKKSVDEISKRATEFQKETIDVPMMNACVLLLDRRYDEAALIEIIHTCGLLCDELGYPMKN